MQVKIDTKEKFTVLTPLINDWAANMAEEFTTIVTNTANQPPHNVIVNLSACTIIEEQFYQTLVQCGASLYEQGYSFVTCCATNNVLQQLAALELEEALNLVPTESEAWDIVQMDEIEREFLQGEE